MTAAPAAHAPLHIDAPLVQRLVAAQFPQWADLPIQPVARSGWDNRTFHLGRDLLVRLPSAAGYAASIGKEQRWLPHLAPSLPHPVPQPIAVGAPTHEYPCKWSINRWLEGETATRENIGDIRNFARDLARFLAALQLIDNAGGPPSGQENFFRGGSLSVYDAQTRQAIATLNGKVRQKAALHIWEAALNTHWTLPPVWVHGDLSQGNVLVQHSELCGVIDFGQLAIGDPACDLAIAWTLFSGESRELFRKTLNLDDATWQRGRAWALWKALILAAGLSHTNAIDYADPWRVIESVL